MFHPLWSSYLLVKPRAQPSAQDEKEAAPSARPQPVGDVGDVYVVYIFSPPRSCICVDILFQGAGKESV